MRGKHTCNCSTRVIVSTRQYYPGWVCSRTNLAHSACTACNTPPNGITFRHSHDSEVWRVLTTIHVGNVTRGVQRSGEEGVGAS